MLTARKIHIIACITLLQTCAISCNSPDSGSSDSGSIRESAHENPVVDAGTSDSNLEEATQDGQELPDIGNEIVNYAGTLADIPYKEAGRDTSGFDCSGFVYYVFKNFNIDIPHSSRHIAMMGREIDLEEARKGDLIFFRGTDPASGEVGHIGIVVSGAGESVKFIHSSSAVSSPCVRFDSLARPNYQKRFLMVKRVLGEQKG